MRAGPLSDDKIIDTLNRYFVPVYVSNEDYEGKTSRVSAEEKQAYQKIYHEALREKRSAGSVCVYLVSPDGKGLASMIVSTAAQKGKLLPLLEETVKKLGTKAGKVLIEPTPQSRPPKTEAGAVVLHLVSRADHRGSWGEFPSENWIVLTATEVAKILPEMGKPGTEWALDKETASKVLTHFYPQTETCDFDHDAVDNGGHHHRIEEVALRGKVLSKKDGVAQCRLDGNVRLKHTFYPGKLDENRANATVVGYLDFDVKTREVRSLRLVTETGTYGKMGFKVAVDSQHK
ncbi:hypothetical protein AYO40_00190 [Planctomycetaceae bacterium SCGC AG-212-D15]|nr:hypothetical protein AYO40_00190 [Planctomycetaceae bacterium SCGC AG-212-D15]